MLWKKTALSFLQKRYADGKIPHSYRIIGYESKRGNFTIIPSEAIIVREIYDLFLKGKTYYQISEELNNRGVKKPILYKTKSAKLKSSTPWQRKYIENILLNEKYCGDVILQKSFNMDVLSNRRVNNGERPKYEIRDNHVGIINREMWNDVQNEIKRRRMERITLVDDNARYSNKYAFSSKIECECGSKFRRHSQTHKTKSGEQVQEYIWVCITHQKQGKLCAIKPIKEKDLEQAFVTAVNTLVANKDRYKEILSKNIETVVMAKEATSADKLKSKLETAQHKLIKINKQKHASSVLEERDRLMDEIRGIQADIELSDCSEKVIDFNLTKLKEIRKVMLRPLTEFDHRIFRILVKSIIVKATNNKPTQLRFILESNIDVTVSI